MRGLDWYTLDDAWSTSGNNPPKNTTSTHPMYTTAKRQDIVHQR
jgi:hypothetical protein